MSDVRGRGWRRLGLGAAVLLLGLYIFGTIRNPEELELTEEARAGSGLEFAPLTIGITGYQVGGPATGRGVVLVHGFSVPSYIYDSTFAALTAAGFQVLRYDLLGRGWSDRPAVDYDAELFDAQLLQLLDHLGWDRPVDLVGLSMGGWVVATFGTRHPERVRSVTLVDPAAGPRSSVGWLRWPLIGRWLWQALIVPGMAESQRGDFVEPSRFPDWVDRYRPQMAYRGFGRALHSTVLALAEVNFDSVYAAFGRQGIRTLLIWGEEDATVPFTLSASVRAAIPNHTFLPVAGAGHLPHIERADQVHAALIPFLSQGLVEPAAHDRAVTAAREVIAAARFATLVTMGPGGHPQARIVDPFPPDSLFTVMVATNARTRKAAEIAQDPRVTLLYFDAAGSSYVTMLGRAELVRDPAERARWWKEEWAAFYQDRNLGDDYLLLRIRPYRLEISSEQHGVLNDPATWRPVIVELP